MRLATAEQMREMDRRAIQERGIPSTQLMEQAAREVVEVVQELIREEGPPSCGRRKRLILPRATGQVIRGEEGACYTRAGDERPPRAAIFCGAGNNGGDGVALARFLLEEGWQVRAFLVGKREKMTCECREMESRLLQAGGRLEEFDLESAEQAAWAMGAHVLVDALFGIGLNTPLRGTALAAVALMNASPAPTVAVDLPSGVEADTGRVLGLAVQAAQTVTFSLAKPGHFVGKGGLCTGKLTVVPIGIPQDLMEISCPVQSVDGGQIRLPRRPRDAHKGEFGRLFLLAGSVGYTGAPVLAAQAAVRSGAGLVYLGVPPGIYPIVAVKCNEAMPFPLPEERQEIWKRASACDAALLGPGLGRGEREAELVRALLEGLECPVVLDADGINAVAGHIDSLDRRRGRITVLTPHDGEFARLACRPVGEDRLGSAREFAQVHGCILVLKGHRTITALPNGAAFVNTTGNPGMAKGGSGDVLAGMLCALLGQGLEPGRAAVTAVYLHGWAGDRCAQMLGEYSMTPTDLVEALPQAFQAAVENR